MRDARIEALNFGANCVSQALAQFLAALAAGRVWIHLTPKRLARSILVRTNQPRIVLDSTTSGIAGEPIATSAPAISGFAPQARKTSPIPPLPISETIS
jgi:hypothetical protein